MSAKTNDIRTAAIIPANSTDLYDLNAVMYDASDRLATCTKTAIGAERFAGFLAGDWSAQVANDTYGSDVGAAAYATPASFASGTGVVRLTVLQEGHTVRIPIVETSGQRGDRVYLSTATAGSQTFTISQQSAGQGQVWVGTLDKDFTGATTLDKQAVIVRPCSVNTQLSDMAYWLCNHVVDGLVPGHDETSRISYNSGRAFVGGKLFHIAAGANLGPVCATHATLARIVLYTIGPGGTVRAIDTGNVKFTYTQAAAGQTFSTVARNSWFWPTMSFGDGVVFAAGVFRSASQSMDASRVCPVRRSLQDVMFRKYITGNPYSSGSPTLR